MADMKPNRPPIVQQIHGQLMQLIQIQRIQPLLTGKQDMLIPRHRMDPRGGAVDVQRTFVENLGETRSHVHQRGPGQSVGHQSAAVILLLRLLFPEMFRPWRRLRMRRGSGFSFHPLGEVTFRQRLRVAESADPERGAELVVVQLQVVDAGLLGHGGENGR